MGNEKEVRFDIYCKKCMYQNLKENEDPCWDCLVETVNMNSKKPVKFKEAENENTNSRSNV